MFRTVFEVSAQSYVVSSMRSNPALGERRRELGETKVWRHMS